ncbi:Tol-Pal system peptidoglycan-associated lipoprotein PAL [hydrothermal vent metagenome]|uniref:Tol-Pal system peptidoglycan-associated lipoprotein PAL n=1 Tax=hydrothermal vent metagenome TaxID=652676 RepID=A0A3B0TJQ2_9ZZZZ
MRSIAPIFSYVKALLMVGLVLGVAACARTPNGGPVGEATPGSQQEFLVTIGDRVFFDTDSSVINAAGQATLTKQAAWLNKYPQFRITIEGHADERGTREYNIALGARRAAAAVNFLVSRGVSANRISSKSYGKERPVAICNDISCWSQNRRAVTVLN